MTKKKVLLIIIGAVCLLVVGSVYWVARPGVEDINPLPNPQLNSDPLKNVMIFGASGTVGDGIFKALLTDKNVKKIQVVTRRLTPRIEKGIEMGKVVVTEHMNYLDYTPIKQKLLNVDAVYWAIGTSAKNVDDEKYTEIHVDFPVAFVKFWLSLNQTKDKSFHLITGAGTKVDSSFHWAREKAKVENQLTTLAQGSGLRFIAYRPSFVMPSAERLTFLKGLFYSPLEFSKLAVKSYHIGQCMIEVTLRGKEIPNGSILNHSSIHSFAEIYRERYGL